MFNIREFIFSPFLFVSLIVSSSSILLMNKLIQEIDLATGTLSTIQVGSRKLLGKANPIYSMQVRDGLLYSVGTSLDGAAVKVCIS